MMGAISGQYYVYIMTNQRNTVLYTDMTNDLKCRTYGHRTGRGSGNCVDLPRKNWATYFTYMVQCVERQEEWPEGGTLSVAYKDLPLGGGNDGD
jgi:hypothetical protein